MRHASDDVTYRFEPAATFYYEDLFAPPEQPPSLLDAVLARLSRRVVAHVSSRRRSIPDTAARR